MAKVPEKKASGDLAAAKKVADTSSSPASNAEVKKVGPVHSTKTTDPCKYTA